jgi:hypothetical protein
MLTANNHTNRTFPAMEAVLDLISERADAIAKSVVLGAVLYPMTIVLLIWAQSLLKNRIKELKEKLPTMDYDETLKQYTQTKDILIRQAPIIEKVKTVKLWSWSWPIAKGIISANKKITTINLMLKEHLFIDTSAIPKSAWDEHVKKMAEMQDIWGDDEDGEYGRLTHSTLHSKHVAK